LNRRKFILGSISGGIFIGSGAAWFGIEKNEQPLNIEFALSELNKLIIQKPIATGKWDLSQILTHCAQSVEYSMHGYPKHNSDFFKSTAGKAAFSLFNSKRKMFHALDEAIPGAPDFSDKENITNAFERFKKSLIDFKNFNGVLAPHFAYGQLSKLDYEAAHVMHFNNHLQEIELTKPLT